MAAARLIVCEKTGRWATALRQAVGDVDWQLTETRATAQCRQQLVNSPDSFVVIEFTPTNLSQRSQLVADVAAEFPRATMAGVVDLTCVTLQWQLRDLGLIDVLSSTRQLDRLVVAIQKHFEIFPPEPPTWRREVEKLLPWRSDRSS